MSTILATEAYVSFERTLAEKNPADRASALVAGFEQMDAQEQFDALVLAFDTLVIDLRAAEEKTAWAVALLTAIDKMAIHFLSAGPADEGQYRKATSIEDAVFAGLRGRQTARRHVPYDREELLSVLLAAVTKGHHNLTLSTSRLYATEAFGPDFAGFRSASAAPAPAAPGAGVRSDGAFSWES
ncbi:hypothetical protein [Arthrobacter sp. 162MFSha1.1]|uniref:hypothetical protein n=1 Tax=Arthrobacter sp. 162MFSha1.1 TaxID=1151119 RepID=UPI00036A1029|nr:hypothetical protein [Arthrobacter sp. 162MFSha1.1]